MSNRLQVHQQQRQPRPQRKREFRDVRLSHSQNKLMSMSQFTQINKSPLKQSQKSQIIKPKQTIDNVTARTSRFNQRQQQSRIQRNERYQNNLSPSNVRSHSHNELVCVGCYNKKKGQILKQKKVMQRIKNQQEQVQLKQSIIYQQKYKQLVNQNMAKHNLQSVKQYNKRLIQRHQNQRQLQQQKRQQQFDEITRKQQQFLRQRQNQAKRSQEQQQNLKAQLRQQMKIHHMKQQKMKNFLKQNTNTSIVEHMAPRHQVHDSIVSKIQNSYKQELLKQIQQKQIKKRKQLEEKNQKQMNNRQKDGNQFQLVTFAEKRNQESKKIANKIKQNALKELNQKKHAEQRKKFQKQQQRYEEEKMRKINGQMQHQQKLKNQDFRRQKIDRYLSDLKKQMEVNKQKRIQQLQWLNQRRKIEPIIQKPQIPEYMKEKCDGCHKNYPKQMLSQFIQPPQ